MINKTIEACDLCGLPVETSDFSLFAVDGLKRFCCEGCQGIYEMLHEGEILAGDDVKMPQSEAGNP